MNPSISAALVGALLVPVPPAPPAAPLSLARTADHSDQGHQVPRSAAVWPLDPRPEVVAGFEPPSVTWAAGHRGVDLLGTDGAPVRSALAGQVTFAGTVAGRGVVVVDHGGFRTTYEPVRAAVQRGARVRTGEVIGSLQSGLSHCLPRSCLHWGLVEDGAYRDPLSLVRSGRVRLLPLQDQALGWARW